MVNFMLHYFYSTSELLAQSLKTSIITGIFHVFNLILLYYCLAKIIQSLYNYSNEVCPLLNLPLFLPQRDLLQTHSK